MGFKKNFFKSIFQYGAFTYVSQFIEFFSTIILSRYILPEEYGFVAIIRIFSEFIAIFSQAGFSHAIIRSNYNRTFWKYVSSLTFWVGVLLFLIITSLSYPISVFFKQPDLLIPTILIGLQFVSINITIVPFALLSKQLKFTEVGAIRLSGSVIRVSLMVIMAITGFSYWSLIVPFVVAPLFEYLFLVIKYKFTVKIYPIKKTLIAYKKIKTLIKNVSAFNLINYWTRNVDNLLIGKFYSNYDLGIYNRAYRFLDLVRRLITSIIGVVIYPSLKKLKEQNEDFRKEYFDILKLINISTFIPAVLLTVVPNEIVLLLWGDDWIEVAQYLPYFAIITLIQPLLSTLSEVFILEGKEKDLFKIGTVCSIIQVIAIVTGAFFSINHIVMLFTLAFLVLILPINMYWGFHLSLEFKLKHVLSVWSPRLITGMLLFVNQYLSLNYGYYIMGAFVVVLIFENLNYIKNRSFAKNK